MVSSSRIVPRNPFIETSILSPLGSRTRFMRPPSPGDARLERPIRWWHSHTGRRVQKTLATSSRWGVQQAALWESGSRLPQSRAFGNTSRWSTSRSCTRRFQCLFSVDNRWMEVHVGRRHVLPDEDTAARPLTAPQLHASRSHKPQSSSPCIDRIPVPYRIQDSCLVTLQVYSHQEISNSTTA
jgi:hypothetical protein